MFMPKKAISVTLDEQNLTWLRSRTLARKGKSVSDTLDGLVTEARLGTRAPVITSVVGTVDIAADDPNLDDADEYVRGVFDEAMARPIVVRERRPAYGAKGKQRG